MSFKSFLAKDKSIRHLPLEEVCEICSGISFQGSFRRESGIPVIKAGNVQDDQITEDNLDYFDSEDHPKAAIIKYGDVVIVRKGSPGKVGINLTNRKFFFSSEIFKFVPKEGILISRYLYHFLLSQQEEIKKGARGIIPGIRKSELGKMRIPIPSLETQERIAHTLDKFREIEREISLRDKQYEYYRNYLINGGSKEVSV